MNPWLIGIGTWFLLSVPLGIAVGKHLARRPPTGRRTQP